MTFDNDPRGRATDRAPEIDRDTHFPGGSNDVSHRLNDAMHSDTNPGDHRGPALGDIEVAQQVGNRVLWDGLSTGASGTVFIGGSTFSINLYITGAFRSGSATEPFNHAAGDATVDGILSVATNAAPASGVKAQVTGAMAVSKWFRAGSLAVLTGATADGDIVGKRVFVEDALFNFAIVSSAPTWTLDTNDYVRYVRSSNQWEWVIGSATVMAVSASGITHAGWASFIANTGVAPANTTAGDLTATRGHFGTDGAFTAGKELEVVGDALVSATLEVGGSVAVGTSAAAASATVNNDTLDTTIGLWRANPAAARTGIILEAGVTLGQRFTLINLAAGANTLTMAAAGTSNVADGVACVVAGLTAAHFVWDTTSARWYRV